MNYRFWTIAIVLLSGVWVGCQSELHSKIKYVFKPAPNNNIAAKIAGKEITVSELEKGIEGDLFDAQKKVFDIKMKRIQALTLKYFMEDDPKKKGLSNDQYLSKYIAKNISVSDSDINDFVKKREVPTEHINDAFKIRVKKFLLMEKKKLAVNKWLHEKMKKQPVEVYLKKPQRPVFDIDIKKSPILGNSGAPVTIVEFSDFQCPYCRKTSETLREVKKIYGNKVSVVFKHFPLPFHVHAKKAALAAQCAESQGKFWKFHDALFDNQSKLTENGLFELAGKIGIDKKKFIKCVKNRDHLDLIERDLAYGQALNIKSTPTLFINGQLVQGIISVDEFKDIIDEQI